MTGNIIVGFAPAATVGAGKAAGTQQAGGPLGLFGALVGAATAGSNAPAGEAALETATAGLLGLAPPLDVEFGLESPAEPGIDGEALLGEFVDALAALDQALANGEPAIPALTERVSSALDALAGLLGVPLPADPAIATDPTSGEAPAGAGSIPQPAPASIDPLPALAGQAVPPREGRGTFTPAPMEAEGMPAPPVDFAIPASFAASPPAPSASPLAAERAAPSGTAQTVALKPPEIPSPEAASVPAVDPDSTLGRLLGKVAELSQALEPQSPGLAKRLEALAATIASDKLSAETLAKLGVDADAPLTEDELDLALQKLLAASSEVKGTPAPQAFAAARLRLPDVLALPPRAEPASSPVPLAAEAAEAGPQTGPRPASSIRLESGAPDRPDSTPTQPRGDFGDALRAAGAAPQEVVEPAPSPPAAQAAATAAATVVAGTKAIHAAYQAPVQQINVPQVAFEIVRQVQAGNSRFQIRLDPPELGRIDVKLEVDRGGNVNARMTVERAETLDLMQRDQRALERALAQAGLDSARTNLEFSLRQNPFARQDGGDGRGGGPPFVTAGGETAAAPGHAAPEAPQSLYRGSIGAGGVNLFV